MRLRRRARRNPEVQPGDPRWLEYQLYKGIISIEDIPYKVLSAWAHDTEHLYQFAAWNEIGRRRDEANEIRYYYLKEKEEKRGLSAREWGELDVLADNDKPYNERATMQGIWLARNRVEEEREATLRWAKWANPLARSPYDVFYALNEPKAAVEYLRESILDFAGQDFLPDAYDVMRLQRSRGWEVASEPVRRMDHLIRQMTTGERIAWPDVGHAIGLWDEVFTKFLRPR